MTRNVSQTDGGIRLAIACMSLLIALDLFAILAGTSWTWTSGIVVAAGAFLLVTGLAGYCPVYAGLHVSTVREEAA